MTDIQNSSVIQCESCARDDIESVADKFCNECSEHICQECVKFHRRNKLLSSHTFRTLEANSDLRLVRSCRKWSKTCSIHPDKQIEYVCKNHENVYCNRCVILSHRNCNVLTVDEFHASPQFIETLGTIQKSLDNLASHVRGHANIEQENIAYIEQTHAVFDKECKAIENEVVTEVKTTFESLRLNVCASVETSKQTTTNKQTQIANDLEELTQSNETLQAIRNGQVNPLAATKQLQELIIKMKQHVIEERDGINKPLRRKRWTFDRKRLSDALANICNVSDHFNVVDTITFDERITFTFENKLQNGKKRIYSRLIDSSFMADDCIICTDKGHKVLRVFNFGTKKQLGSIHLDVQPYGITHILDNHFAVTFPDEKFICEYNIQIDQLDSSVKFELLRTIETEHGMYGVRKYNIDKSNIGIITLCLSNACFFFYTLDGQLLQTMKIQNTGLETSIFGMNLLAHANCFDVDPVVGRIYITFRKLNKVYCYNFAGELVFVHVAPNSMLQTPVGIACGPNGDVFVSCYGNGRIQRLDNHGILQQTYDFKTLMAPTFMVFNQDQSRCVICDYNSPPEINVFKIESSNIK